MDGEEPDLHPSSRARCCHGGRQVLAPQVPHIIRRLFHLRAVSNQEKVIESTILDARLPPGSPAGAKDATDLLLTLVTASCEGWEGQCILRATRAGQDSDAGRGLSAATNQHEKELCPLLGFSRASLLVIRQFVVQEFLGIVLRGTIVFSGVVRSSFVAPEEVCPGGTRLNVRIVPLGRFVPLGRAINCLTAA